MNHATGFAMDALGPQWDPERDVAIVWWGSQQHGALESLRRQGQRRILVVVDNSAVPPAGSHFVCVGPRDDLTPVLARWLHPPPERFAKIHDERVSPEAADAFAQRVQHAQLQASLGSNASRRYGPTLVEQTSSNLDDVAAHHGVDALAGAFAGKSALIVCPGPSLEKNLTDIPAVAKHAVVIAVGHAVAALDGVGVVPDIVISVDMLDQSYLFEGVDTSRVPAFVLAASCHRAVVELPARQRFFCSGGRSFDRWPFEAVGENGYLANPGSVAGSAFSLAHHLGCNAIAFVGLDLAYSGGKYYARGVAGGDRTVVASADGQTLEIRARRSNGDIDPRVRFREAALELPGYHGGTVPTSPQFAAFHAWFRDKAVDYGRSARILNCTQGGAFIDGMKHVPLLDAQRRYFRRPLDAASILARFDIPPASDRRDVMLRQREHLKSMLTRFSRPSQKFLALTDKLTRRHRERDYERFLSSYPAIVRALNELPWVVNMHRADVEAAVATVQSASDACEQAVAAASLIEIGRRSSKLLARSLDRPRRDVRDAA